MFKSKISSKKAVVVLTSGVSVYIAIPSKSDGYQVVGELNPSSNKYWRSPDYANTKLQRAVASTKFTFNVDQCYLYVEEKLC